MLDDGKTLSAFLRLLKILRPQVVLDIGSMDAGHSHFFRDVAPASRIIAIEANPYNYADVVRSGNAVKWNVEWEYCAISDTDGVADFNVLQFDRESQEPAWERGGSSLLFRIHGNPYETIRVPSKRLDTFLAERGLLHHGKAIWMDIEGAVELMLAGARESLTTTHCIHVELEGDEMFSGQTLGPDIVSQFEKLGFVPILSSDDDGTAHQYDVVFVAKTILDLI
jgi:FkbM family methyltransferase